MSDFGLSPRAVRLLGLDEMCECGHEYGLHQAPGTECVVIECKCGMFRRLAGRNRMNFLYVLDEDHNVVFVGDDIRRWGNFFLRSGDARRVGFDEIGNVYISTVFLGIDHRIPMNPRLPIVFETMIFRNGKMDECLRCATWNEAVAQHKAAVERVKRSAPA